MKYKILSASTIKDLQEQIDTLQLGYPACYIQGQICTSSLLSDKGGVIYTVLIVLNN